MEKKYFNSPIQSQFGRERTLTTGLVHCEALPLGHPAIELKLTNQIPLVLIRGRSEAIPATFQKQEYEQRFCEADTETDSDMAALLKGETSLCSYRASVRFYYRQSNVLSKELIRKTGIFTNMPIENCIVNNTMDAVLFQPLEHLKDWQSKEKTRFFEIGAYDLRKPELDVTRGQRDKKYHERGKKFSMYISGKKGKWILCGQWPDSSYEPKEGDNIYTRGRGIVILVNLDISKLITYSLIKLQLGPHKGWLKLNPAQEKLPVVELEEEKESQDQPAAQDTPPEIQAKEEQAPAKKGKKGKKRSKKSETEDGSTEQAPPSSEPLTGNLGEMLQAKGQALPVLENVPLPEASAPDASTPSATL